MSGFRRHRLRFAQAGLLCALMLLAAPGRADEASDKFLASMGLQGYTVTYEDEEGRPLTQAEFVERRKAMPSFSMSREIAKKSAVLRLGDPAHLNDEPAARLKPGDAFPDLTGLLIDGQAQTLKVASPKFKLLAFFMESCAPCIAEIPDLNAIAAQQPQIQVTGVSPDTLASTRRIAQRYGIRYATLSEAKGSIDRIGVKSYPLLVLLRPDGRVAAVRRGYSVSRGTHLAELEAWLSRGMAASLGK